MVLSPIGLMTMAMRPKSKGDKRMKLTNLEIYNIFTQLNENFTGDEKLPIKLNFIFQKNSKTLIELIKEIEAARMEIGKKYGELKEGGYEIPSENVEAANSEYTDLMSVEQEVNITTISIDKLPDDLMLTTGQMNALSFMITEE